MEVKKFSIPQARYVSVSTSRSRAHALGRPGCPADARRPGKGAEGQHKVTCDRGRPGGEPGGVEMSETTRMKNLLAGVAGGLAGGALGYLAFIWIARQGFYALMLPGALAGFGASLFVSNRSVRRGVVCGVFALGLGLFAEWRFAPFIKDLSFGYFLVHVANCGRSRC